MDHTIAAALAPAEPAGLLWALAAGLVMTAALLALDRCAPTLTLRAVLGTCLAGALGMTWLAASHLGLTPASSREREVVSFVRESFGERERVKAALRAAERAMYLSSSDVERIAQAAQRP